MWLPFAQFTSTFPYGTQVGRPRPNDVRSQISHPPNGILGFQLRMRQSMGNSARILWRLWGSTGWKGYQWCSISQWRWVAKTIRSGTLHDASTDGHFFQIVQIAISRTNRRGGMLLVGSWSHSNFWSMVSCLDHDPKCCCTYTPNRSFDVLAWIATLESWIISWENELQTKVANRGIRRWIFVRTQVRGLELHIMRIAVFLIHNTDCRFWLYFNTFYIRRDYLLEWRAFWIEVDWWVLVTDECSSETFVYWYWLSSYFLPQLDFFTGSMKYRSTTKAVGIILMSCAALSMVVW